MTLQGWQVLGGRGPEGPGGAHSLQLCSPKSQARGRFPTPTSACLGAGRGHMALTRAHGTPTGLWHKPKPRFAFKELSLSQHPPGGHPGCPQGLQTQPVWGTQGMSFGLQGRWCSQWEM